MLLYIYIYIYIYSPRAGADNPLGTNVNVNRKPLSLCPFVASFKINSLNFYFKHIFNYFMHVYSPRAGTDNPGQNVDVNRKPLSLCPFIASLKKKSDFIHIFNDFIYVHVYSPGARADNLLGTNF